MNPSAPSVVIQTAVQPNSDKAGKDAGPWQLESLRPHVDPTIFAIYVGIYTSFEAIIVSTVDSTPSRGPSSLRSLAARKLAHCILATESETAGDDVWYDTAADIGVGGEYLREIVRWHAVEVIRDAFVEGLMPVTSEHDKLGLVGVLVGLCRMRQAEAEAESLLQTMLELQPFGATLTTATNTLLAHWLRTPRALYRIFAKNMPAMDPVAMGNSTLHRVIEQASTQVAKCEEARTLVKVALENVFGVWGANHSLVANEARKLEARRKGNHRNGRRVMESAQAIQRRPRSVSMRIVLKAEERTLTMIEYLVLKSLSTDDQNTVGLIDHIVRGFLIQDDDTKAYIEGLWEEYWPVAGKVTLLLRMFGCNLEDDTEIIREMVHCIEDVRSTLGKDGVRSLATFVASCYGKLYWSSGNPKTPRDEVKHLVDLLIASISPSGQVSTRSSTTNAKTLQTPKPKRNVVAFTPYRSSDTNTEDSAERYYISQFALNVANEFVSLDLAKKNDGWIKWAERVERAVVGLKVRPPKPKRADCPFTSAKKERKGWRWEEGIDAWVAIGGTPGAKLKKERGHFGRGLFAAFAVEVQEERNENWKSEYEVFDENSKDGQSESDFSIEIRSEGSQATESEPKVAVQASGRIQMCAVELPKSTHTPASSISSRTDRDTEKPTPESATTVSDSDSDLESESSADSSTGGLRSWLSSRESKRRRWNIDTPSTRTRSAMALGEPALPEPDSVPSSDSEVFSSGEEPVLPRGPGKRKRNTDDVDSDLEPDEVQVRARYSNSSEGCSSGEESGGEMSEDELSFSKAPALQVVVVHRKPLLKRKRW